MLHTLAQLGDGATTFVLAHVIEPLDGLLQCGGYMLLELVSGITI